jgi:hypothetical protein
MQGTNWSTGPGLGSRANGVTVFAPSFLLSERKDYPAHAMVICVLHLILFSI